MTVVCSIYVEMMLYSFEKKTAWTKIRINDDKYVSNFLQLNERENLENKIYGRYMIDSA